MKPKHWSISQERMLERCGKQSAYRYVEGLKIPPDLGQIRGRAVHGAAEGAHRAKFENHPIQDADEIRAMAEAVFNDEIRQGDWTAGDYIGGREDASSMKRAKAAALDDTVNSAARYWLDIGRTISPAALPDGQPAVEFEVKLPAEATAAGVPILGIIDLVDQASIVRDLKTVSRRPPANSEHSDAQLTMYYWLMQAGAGLTPEQLTLDVVIVARGTEVRTTTRSEVDVHHLRSRLEPGLQIVEAEIWLPTSPTNWWCSKRWCGYWDICPYGARGRSRPEA